MKKENGMKSRLDVAIECPMQLALENLALEYYHIITFYAISIFIKKVSFEPCHRWLLLKKMQELANDF
jgi:hypothetical protein